MCVFFQFKKKRNFYLVVILSFLLSEGKMLKGAYIKFEDCSRMYRPIKSELDRWPKVNPLAPPGLNPFTEAKMKISHMMTGMRKQLMKNRTKRSTGYGSLLSSKTRTKGRSSSRCTNVEDPRYV